MCIRALNRYQSLMAKSIEMAIISSGNPFVEVYLERLDCSVAVELAQLRTLQEQARLHPDKDLYLYDGVLRKYLYNWKGADRFFAVVGLKPSAKWAEGWYSAMRQPSTSTVATAAI